jgi:hypothetical protein
MRTSISSLFALAALVAASPLSAVVTQTITNANWTSLSGVNLGSGTNPDGGISGSNYSIGGTSFASYIAGGTSDGPNAAAAALSAAVTQYSNSATFGGNLYITFAAQRVNTGTGASNYDNFKLLQGSNANSGIVLGIGSVSDAVGLNNWGVAEGAQSTSTTSLFPNSSVIGTATSMSDTVSYITLMIDYASNADDTVYVWRTSQALDIHNLTTASAGFTQTGDYSFDRLGVYAGLNTTLAFSDLTVTVPEPSTYALLFGAATLGFVGYRRFRKRQA